jgi:hypothetical protein
VRAGWPAQALLHAYLAAQAVGYAVAQQFPRISARALAPAHAHGHC